MPFCFSSSRAPVSDPGSPDRPVYGSSARRLSLRGIPSEWYELGPSSTPHRRSGHRRRSSRTSPKLHGMSRLSCEMSLAKGDARCQKLVYRTGEPHRQRLFVMLVQDGHCQPWVGTKGTPRSSPLPFAEGRRTLRDRQTAMCGPEANFSSWLKPRSSLLYSPKL